MKYCSYCGAENPEEAKFCFKCGKPMLNGGSTEQSRERDTSHCDIRDEASNAGEARKAIPMISKGEAVLAVIGNSFLQNVIMGSGLRRNIAVVTNRRLYYSGRVMKPGSLSETSMTEDGSVLLSDITYSGMKSKKAFWWLILAIIFAIPTLLFGVTALSSLAGISHWASSSSYSSAEEGGAVAFIMSLVLTSIVGMITYWFWRQYQKRGTTAFVVSFAGGGMMFDVRYYSKAELDNFRTTLTRAAESARW